METRAPLINLDEPASDVDLYLIGKTGHGKSATGNNILGSNVFTTYDSGASGTIATKVAWAKRAGLIIKVVDGPGLEDTRLTGDEQNQQTEKNIMRALLHCPYGFHALLLILKYGNSFTREEQKTVETLKKMLGDTLIKNHCILVFTYGECFDLNNKGKSTTFQDWCESQTGALKALIDECGNRCLLFYNLTEKKSDSSLSELLEILQVRTRNNRRYTHKLFEKTRATRRSFIEQESAPQLWEPMFSRLMMLTRATQALTLATASNAAKLEEIDLVEEHSEQLEKSVTKCMERKQNDESKNVLTMLHETVLILKVESGKLVMKRKNKYKVKDDPEEEIRKCSSRLQEIQEKGMVKLERLHENYDA